MNRWLQKIETLNPKFTFWSIVFSAILLAAWMQYIQHGWINPDSVLYFEQAQLISQGNFKGAMDVFPWPFYGAFIAAVHMATGAGIQLSAQILNMLFFGLSMAAFLRIISLCGGTVRTALIGTLLVFGGQYIVGDVLEMLLRDVGFWAFFLWALFFFLRFYLQQKPCDAFYWQIAIGLAILFRLETILYALLLPCAWLMRTELPPKQRLKLCLQSYSLGLLAAIAISLRLTLSPVLSMQDFGRLSEIFTPHLYQEFTQKLFSRADIMSEQVLGKYLEEFAVSGLLITFVWVMVAKTFTAAGIIGTVLAVFGIRQRNTLLPQYVQWVLLATICIAIFSMYLIIVKVFVLSSRYVVALAWVLLIFAAFYWGNFLKAKPKHWLHAILLVILLLGFVKNIMPKRAGYNYQQDAVTWIKSHNPDNLPVFYDEERMRYYAREPFIPGWHNVWNKQKFDYKKDFMKYQFITVNVSVKKSKSLAHIGDMLSNYREATRFCDNKNKKCVFIYMKQ